MLKSLGGWFGAGSENGRVQGEGGSRDASGAAGRDASPPRAPPGLSGYVYHLASNASKKLSESVVGTAQTLRRSVEDGKISGIIDKTILGDFQKEQERFVQEKKAAKSGAAVPPWVGYDEEEAVQHQILSLSADKRNFLRDPPAGVQFHFDFEQMHPVAAVMLEEDELLRRMRFHLVPKQVKEEAFWRNYFYRVSLIKQSAQLTALAAERRHAEKPGSGPEDAAHDDAAKRRTPKPGQEEEQTSGSPVASEFASDAFGSCGISEDILRREVELLVLDERAPPDPRDEEAADWERELQEELQDYEVLADAENRDDNWDQEIEEMLKEDS